MSATAQSLARVHRLSVADYHRMGETGILGPANVRLNHSCISLERPYSSAADVGALSRKTTGPGCAVERQS